MNLSPKDLLDVDHKALHCFEALTEKRFTGVSTDSRNAKPGNIFFAIRGEKYDGHKFIRDAFSSGASCVVVDERSDSREWRTIPAVVVSDTTKALGELARLYRQKFDIPFIAVAGSNGKTTTKEMIAAVLGKRYNVISTEKNFNNHVGVPQTLFRLSLKHQIAVVEIGTNHFGELEYLCNILDPTHGVITNIGREHLEYFKTVIGAARAEGELFRYLSLIGFGFVNADDNLVNQQAKYLKKKIKYGFSKSNLNVRGELLSLDRTGCATFRVKARKRKEFSVPMSIPGSHAAMNGLAAATIGLTFGISPVEIRRALGEFTAVGKRMEVVNLGPVTILNDSYNSNPDSVITALETLRSIKTDMKKVVVLADMLELGAAARREHERIGKLISSMGFKYLLTHGTLARFINEKANVELKIHYDKKEQLMECASKLIVGGGYILVKGSREMRMEELVASLTERFRKKVA